MKMNTKINRRTLKMLDFALSAKAPVHILVEDGQARLMDWPADFTVSLDAIEALGDLVTFAHAVQHVWTLEVTAEGRTHLLNNWNRYRKMIWARG